MIQNRHQLLLDTIGVKTEESTALQRVSLWQWVSPLLVTLAWIIDCILIIFFHWFVHPWVDIVREDTKGDMERILQKTREHLETKDQQSTDLTIDVDTQEEQLFEYSLYVRKITHNQ